MVSSRFVLSWSTDYTSIQIQDPPNLFLVLFFADAAVSLCITVYHCVSLCFTVYHCVSLCITVFHCVSLCITVYHCVSLWITVFHCVSLCITVFHCVSLCFTVYHCAQLHQIPGNTNSSQHFNNPPFQSLMLII